MSELDQLPIIDVDTYYTARLPVMDEHVRDRLPAPDPVNFHIGAGTPLSKPTWGAYDQLPSPV